LDESGGLSGSGVGRVPSGKTTTRGVLRICLYWLLGPYLRFLSDQMLFHRAWSELRYMFSTIRAAARSLI
jgi:hypothetical protein